MRKPAFIRLSTWSASLLVILLLVGVDYANDHRKPHTDRSITTLNSGSAYDILLSVTTVSTDELLLTGRTSSHDAELVDGYLALTDSNGEPVWEETFGGEAWDELRVAVEGTDGGYLAAGTSESTDNETYDFWVVKVDAAGSLEWQTMYGSDTEDDQIDAVLPAADGGYYLAGFTNDDLDDNRSNVFLVKIDQNGQLEWQNSYGSERNDYCNAIAFTGDNHLLLAGSTFSYEDEHRDIHLAKVELDGDLVSETLIQIPHPQICNAMVANADGSFTLCGETYPDDDTEFSSAFVARIDSDLQLDWMNTYGSNGSFAAQDIVIRPGGGYYLSGRATPNNEVAFDGWVFTVTQNGNLDESWEFGGGAYEEFYGIDLVSGDIPVAVGYTSYSASRLADFYMVIDLEDSVEVGEERLPMMPMLMQVYPNPFNSTAMIELDLPVRSEVQVVLYDMLGREVTVVADQVAGPGSQQISISAETLASGTYIVYASTDTGHSAARKLTLVK